MRRLLQSLAVLSVTPVALALPVLSRPLPRPHAVAPTVVERAVGGIDATAARNVPGFGVAAGPAPSTPLALTRAVRSATFEALGVTWDAGSGDDVEVVARVRQHGAWTPWHVLDADTDHGPDDATTDTATHRLRGGTSPWFTGDADGYQVRVGVVGGSTPRGIRVSLVDPGTSAADATIGARPTLGDASALATAGRPSYVTRAQWGADESLRDGSPDYGDTIKMGFVHHTDSGNGYSPAQAAALVRSVYAFHTRSRGWSDIGYNFLVDKYGRVFEGRYGGVERPVIGAHTGGFNTDTFGVALLGNYAYTAPSSAQLGALQRTFAWKLGLHFVDPLGRTTMTSRGGTKYAEGTRVTLNNVSGHRDAGLTSCPGQQTYNRLPSIRNAVKAYMGASLYYPSATARSALYLTTTNVTVRATAPVAQAWRLDVRNVRTGALVRQVTGAQTSSIDAVWNLRDKAGLPVTPEVYSLTLNSWTSTSTAKPYAVRVDVRSPLPSGIAIAPASGVAHGLVDNGGIVRASAALVGAVRPSPPLVAYYGSRMALPQSSAPPRDGLFVKTPAGNGYVVVDGARRYVSPSVASALGLTSPVALPSAMVVAVPGAPPWTDATRHPDGQVVKAANGTMWRIESGVRRPFTSAASRGAWTKRFAAPLATTGDLALPLGAPLPPPEGVVLRTATGAGVVSGGTFRLLTNAAALGYAVSTAPLATDADLAALPAGQPVGTGRHPSGALLRNGTTFVEVLGTSRRLVPPVLAATDPRAPVAPESGELTALTTTQWLPPSGLAGRAADGTVRVVESGRLVTLTTAAADALGYATAALPALEVGDFGPLPAGPALVTTSAHPAGTLVTDGTTTWLVDGGARRPVAASLVQTWRGRPALPAKPGDLALPAGRAAPPQTGAWVVTPDGVRWLVDRGLRRSVTTAVARRLGLSRVTAQPVVAAELTRSTTAGTPVP